jgi:hypothetical protein
MIHVFGHRADDIQMLGSIGNTPSRGTRPKVVFKPMMPQQAAGTRIEPAVLFQKRMSTSPLATAAAEPLDEPPRISLRHLLKGFFGVPK